MSKANLTWDEKGYSDYNLDREFCPPTHPHHAAHSSYSDGWHRAKSEANARFDAEDRAIVQAERDFGA